MFGTVLNETLSLYPEFDLNDGATFASFFFNRTFDLGYTKIYIDEVGERIEPYIVQDLDTVRGEFKVCLGQVDTS